MRLTLNDAAASSSVTPSPVRQLRGEHRPLRRRQVPAPHVRRDDPLHDVGPFVELLDGGLEIEIAAGAEPRTAVHQPPPAHDDRKPNAVRLDVGPEIRVLLRGKLGEHGRDGMDLEVAAGDRYAALGADE